MFGLTGTFEGSGGGDPIDGPRYEIKYVDPLDEKVLAFPSDSRPDIVQIQMANSDGPEPALGDVLEVLYQANNINYFCVGYSNNPGIEWQDPSTITFTYDNSNHVTVVSLTGSAKFTNYAYRVIAAYNMPPNSVFNAQGTLSADEKTLTFDFSSCPEIDEGFCVVAPSATAYDAVGRVYAVECTITREYGIDISCVAASSTRYRLNSSAVQSQYDSQNKILTFTITNDWKFTTNQPYFIGLVLAKYCQLPIVTIQLNLQKMVFIMRNIDQDLIQ